MLNLLPQNHLRKFRIYEELENYLASLLPGWEKELGDEREKLGCSQVRLCSWVFNRQVLDLRVFIIGIQADLISKVIDLLPITEAGGRRFLLRMELRRLKSQLSVIG